MRVALFITCISDTLFPESGWATVEILERLGHAVSFPEQQTCCGQMHVNSGYAQQALPMLRRFIDVFGGSRYDAIVAPSGSCTAMVRHHYGRLAAEAGDHQLQAQVTELSAKVFELTEFLVGQLGVDDVGAYYPHRVVYHPSCHATRMLRIGDAPLRLLRNVRGIDLQELPEAESCCGFGGTFSVKNPDVSGSMLADKMRCVTQTGAEVCAGVDSSCLMHIGGGLERLKTGVQTVHIAQILASRESA